MSDFVSLSCPSCGAKLEITSDIEKFACMHCGNEHVVKRSGGIVTLHPLIEEIKKLSSGIDTTGAELSLVRIEKEINNQIKEKEKYYTNCYEYVYKIFRNGIA
jgi:DNA-directed RNA polymerase subunit RPC12/RpoP